MPKCEHANRKKQKFCPDCGEASPVTKAKFPCKVDIYLHGSKEDNWIKGEEIGLSEEAIKENFAYTAYEVRLTYEVQRDGTTKLLAVNDNYL